MRKFLLIFTVLALFLLLLTSCDFTQTMSSQSQSSSESSSYSEHESDCAHQWQNATCQVPKTCRLCGDTSGDTLAHTWIEATCQSPKFCSVCDTPSGAPLGHKWQGADCESPRYCPVCEVSDGLPLGHTWKSDGCLSARYCSVCNESDGEILGHTWQGADCESARYCSVCNETDGNALGHTWVSEGCEEPRSCSACNKRESIILGHSWQNATCELPRHCARCDKTVGNALGHRMTVKATCEHPKKCERCEHTEGEALPHQMNDFWTLGENEITNTCTLCQKYTQRVTDCTEHDLVAERVTEQSVGYKCSLCSVVLSSYDVIHVTISDAPSGYRATVSSKLSSAHLNVASMAGIIRDENGASVSVTSSSFTFQNHFSERLDEITELEIGEGVCEIDALSIFTVSKLYINESVERLGESCVFSLENLTDVYFEGDAPELEADAFFYPTSIYKPVRPTIWISEGASGFDGYGAFIDECTLKCVSDPTPSVPNVTMGEYSYLSAQAAEVLALSLYREAIKGDYFFTALMPQCSINEYKRIKDFALELTKDATSDYERARIIFDWTIQNIEYDEDALVSSVHNVFDEKKAVCAGYTGLMHDMLAAVGIVSFYTRGISYFNTACTPAQMVNKEFENYQSNTHAWIIFITSEGEAVTCDPTWGDFDISSEQMASSGRATAMLEGITVLPEGFDFSLYPSSVFYMENTLYSVDYGKITLFSSVGFKFNEFYDVNYRFHKRYDGNEVSSGTLPPFSSAFKGEFITYDGGIFGYSSLLVSSATFNTVSYRDVLLFVAFEELYYQNDIEIPRENDFIILSDGTAYLSCEGWLSVFGSCSQADEITLASSIEGTPVTEIHSRAFEHSTLESIILPSSVEKIGYHAFLNNDYITELIIPSSVKHIEPGTFAYCDNLKTLTLYAGIEIIGFTESTTACFPTDLFASSGCGEITVYFVGTQEELNAIFFPDPMISEEAVNEFERDVFLAYITVVSPQAQ